MASHDDAPPAARRVAAAAPALFSATLFAGALLLFWVQPMIARMLLPTLGGAPAVWNTCMIFFQAALLAGYGWAHLSERLGPGRQAVAHLGLLALAALALPVGLARAVTPSPSSPVTGLLAALTVAVGLPALAVAATAPLLQRWFSRTGHRDAGDPYFLYAASNLGSMAALVGYPFVIEPMLDLRGQSVAWAAGYALLALLVAACAATVRRLPAPAAGEAAAVGGPTSSPTARLRARWLILALLPSSLLLGVTQHITTDIASIPLLWVLPLGLYLAAYVVAFSRRRVIPHRVVLVAQVPLVLAALLLDAPLSLHLAAFFAVTLACNGELVASRPSRAHLTEFYLWTAVGGLLGGSATLLLAPLVFSSVTEYPLAMAASLAIRPAGRSAASSRRAGLLDLLLPILVGGAAAAAMALLPDLQPFRFAGMSWGPAEIVTAGALACAVAMARRPARLGLAAALTVLAVAFSGDGGDIVLRQRTFFGVITVRKPMKDTTLLMHGSTMHGLQVRTPELRREPLLYYHRGGPMGDIVAALAGKLEGRSIAVAGLGSGAIAAYGRPGQRMVFYEIDPAMERIARDPRCFTYLADSAATIDVVIGDARLKLAEAPPGTFSLIVIDAFSSDAIPTHLLTREALATYLSRLTPDGVLVYHISSRNLDLTSVLAALAADARLECVQKLDPGDRDLRRASAWFAMARRLTDYGGLYAFPDWEGVVSDAGDRLWTDAYLDMTKVLRFR